MRHDAGDDLGVFLAVCQADSFAATVPRVGLSPSAVAKAVARLENRLGVTLFRRTTRRLALTEEGAVYRDVCRAARGAIDDVEGALALAASQPAGTVRISLPPLFGAAIVAPALYDLMRTWPRLGFDMSTSVERIDLIGRGIDLAVRIGALPDLPGLVARRLGTQTIVLCGSAAYFATRAVPRSVADLAGHALISGGGNWSFREADGTIRMWEPRSALVLEGSALTLSALRAGLGVGLVPHWLVQQDIAAGTLIPMLGNQLAGHLPIHALWPATPVMLPRLRVTIDAIVARVQQGLAQSP